MTDKPRLPIVGGGSLWFKLRSAIPSTLLLLAGISRSGVSVPRIRNQIPLADCDRSPQKERAEALRRVWVELVTHNYGLGVDFAKKYKNKTNSSAFTLEKFYDVMSARVRACARTCVWHFAKCSLLAKILKKNHQNRLWHLQWDGASPILLLLVHSHFFAFDLTCEYQ